MLTIFVGNNTVESRSKLKEYRELLISKNYEIFDLRSDINELSRHINDRASLFSINRAFFIENAISKKANRDLLKKIGLSSEIELVIWEEQVAVRDAKKYFPKARFFSFDFSESIWKLLDGLIPGKKTQMIEMLEKLKNTTEEQIILFMLQKRAKELILAKKNALDSKLASWQSAKLKQQAVRWNEETLLQLYDKLFDIEKGVKTSKLSYSVSQALEVVFCFYL